ncbi:MAG TPA: ABC transporter ATP-binding protein [Pirellulales bacterium]|nr:ABC transporter ATP-binding protein [Pirellulales bacterium]
MIRLTAITQHYGVRPVLRQVTLTVAAGERVVILGPNGMGKTTLLAVMAGVLQPQRGEVEIDGLHRRSSPEVELAIRQRVVYLPDHPWLPKNRTGREFLLGVGRVYGLDDERLLDHSERLLRLFELEREGDWPIRSYSNGQQKKIAICSALITEAPVLLLDEPFSGGLDPSGILALKRVLQGLNERRQTTVVLTMPVPEMVEEVADRIVVVRDGQVLAFDTPAGLRQLTNCTGPLSEVLERLVHATTLDRIERYFQDAPR